ncbi:MAG: PspC domain-containing protein [Bacteroidales bacterium]|nr:PspC domain-containing protein [Bacteroidales bacterium]
MDNNKRLERDTRNKAIGGVCSGLANYFDMDPAFWRVLFFLLFVFGGSGLLIYIILWAVMPEKKDYGTVDEPIQQAAGMDVVSEQRRKNNNMATGLVLIALGLIFLFAQYIPEISWRTVWPILLIILGLVFIIPSKKNDNEK